MFNNLKQLYRYRALVWALVTRHLSMRYRGSVLGFLWTFLNPLCLMLVYTLVFRYYIRFNQVEHYTIFLFCGLLPWIWLTSALMEGASSIVSSGHLITKSMFPAHILPTVSVITTLINFLFSLPLLILFMLLAGMPIHATIVFLPVLILLQTLLVWGLVLGLGALNVYYRDVQHILGNILTFLFFLCPILYPLESVPDAFKFTMNLNPFALLTVSYHNLILEGNLPSAVSIISLVVAVLLSLLLGSAIFDRYHESFAELL